MSVVLFFTMALLILIVGSIFVVQTLRHRNPMNEKKGADLQPPPEQQPSPQT